MLLCKQNGIIAIGRLPITAWKADFVSCSEGDYGRARSHGSTQRDGDGPHAREATGDAAAVSSVAVRKPATHRSLCSPCIPRPEFPTWYRSLPRGGDFVIYPARRIDRRSQLRKPGSSPGTHQLAHVKSLIEHAWSSSMPRRFP